MRFYSIKTFWRRV